MRKLNITKHGEGKRQKCISASDNHYLDLKDIGVVVVYIIYVLIVDIPREMKRDEGPCNRQQQLKKTKTKNKKQKNKNKKQNKKQKQKTKQKTKTKNKTKNKNKKKRIDPFKNEQPGSDCAPSRQNNVILDPWWLVPPAAFGRDVLLKIFLKKVKMLELK